MTVYHVETKEAYDELMIELEKQGYKWRSGEKLTDLNEFSTHGKDTYVYEECCEISISSGDYFKKHYSDVPVIEYKAKGENMLNTECKQCHKKWHHDNAKYCEMCGKKLIDEPEFKVGDYVIEQNGNVISKIEEVLNGDFWGSYYKKINNYFGNSGGNILVKDIERYAAPEEIKEYESALNFYKHGREPFEVKKGDLIRTPSEKITLIWYPENFTKTEFLDWGWEFLKTAEEIDEWLGVADETK